MNKPTYVFCSVSHFSIWVLLLFFHLHILCRLHVVLCTNSMSPTCRSIPVPSKSWLRIKIHKEVKSCWLVRCTGSNHNMEETFRVIIITVKNLVVMWKVAGTRLESLSAEQLCNVVLNKDNNDHNCLYMNAILTSPTCCNHLEMVLV